MSEVNQEMERNRFSVIRRGFLGEALDTDIVGFSAAEALEKGMKTDSYILKWAEENPIVAVVEVKITPVRIVSVEDAKAELDEMNAALKS